MKKLGIDQIDHEAYHHLFLFRIALGNEECESCESCIVDLHFTIFLESVSIFLEEPDEEECSNSLVPISKWMILDDEIKEMCRLFLDRRIEILPIKSSDDTREYPDKTLIFLIAKYLIGF